jgi:predicted nucleotidyltransferase
MNALHSPLFQLEGRLGVKWQHLRAAKERSIGKRSELLKAIRRIDSDDVSVVVFGSLARDEFTEQSDIDWTLLVDGGVDPQHLSLAARIEAVIAKLADKRCLRQGFEGHLEPVPPGGPWFRLGFWPPTRAEVPFQRLRALLVDDGSRFCIQTADEIRSRSGNP